jgi:hypothetical protein
MNDQTPIVPGWLDFSQIHILCTFCGRIHYHGSAQAGTRISHCTHDQQIYEIRLLTGKMPAIMPFIEKQVKKLERRYMNRRIRPDRYIAEREQLLLCIRALCAGLLAAEPECVYSFSETIRGLYSPKKRGKYHVNR